MTILSGISSMATQGLLAELGRACLQETGVEIRFESVGGVEAARRVQGGEVFDLVVLSADAIDKLLAGGFVRPGSLCAIADSRVAIAVRAGSVHPDVSSEAALRQALLSAGRIGYSTGPSGVAVLKLFERWGLGEALAGKLVQSKPGVPVASLLASGEADLGFQQLSELRGQPGIELIGGMPPGHEIVTRFVGAVGTGSTQCKAATAALAFLASPARDEARQGQGMTTPAP